MRETNFTTVSDDRRASAERPQIAGVVVREDDIETVKGIRAIALLFRGMAVLLLLLMAAQVVFGLTSSVPLSPGVLFADAVRLIIFAGLLWGGGELAVLWVKSHYDIRAQRILTARIAYMLQQELGGRPGRAPVQ
jgi:hypothetical protein